MLVLGLSENEIARLDLFEGEEYTRRAVEVQSISDGESYSCETYIYLDSTALEDTEWDFASFEKDKLHLWTGEKGESEYSMLSENGTSKDGTGGRSSFR